MPIERKPPVPVARDWSPDGAVQYRVKDGDSWESIARRNGLTAAALIRANFKTVVPSEVNWYLRNHVGCNRPTRDGQDWMFSASARPGTIWIPLEAPEPITGRLPPRFYSVTCRPEDWQPAPRDDDYVDDIATRVVTRDPWTQGNLTLGSLRIRTRSEWGASEPIWANEVIYYNTITWPLAQIYNTIVVHHTDNSHGIKYNEQHEESKRQFAAIGYHFFIDPDGTVLQGRPMEVMGSHAGQGLTPGPLNDPDWGAVGIVLQGDFHHGDDILFHDDPSASQLASLRALILALRARYSGLNRLLMHKEVVRGGAATVCPGDALYGPVAAMRQELGMIGGAP